MCNFVYGQKNDFFSLTQISYGAEKAGNNPACGFKTVLGYQINTLSSIGVGLGIDSYENLALLPVTLDARFTFLKSKVRPTFNASIGYSSALRPNKKYFYSDSDYATLTYSGGLILSPSIGIKVYLPKDISIFFDIGYKMQKTKSVSNYEYLEGSSWVKGQNTVNKTLNMFSLSVGFQF